MKKWFVGILLLVLAGLIICSYWLVPSKIALNQSETAEITQSAAFRVLSNNDKWYKWWKNEAGISPENGSPFTYNGYQFKMISHITNVIGVEISKGDLKLNSYIHLINFRYDSLLLLWTTDTLLTTQNPIKRILAYQQSKEIGASMDSILKNFRPYVVVPLNVYDCNIYRTSTEDTTMLCTRHFTKTEPTTAELYSYLDEIEKSIQKQKGFSKSFPLMEVIKIKQDSFETEVAIPTNVQLKDDGNVFYRRMEPGNFIATNIMGGPYTVSAAFDQLIFFTADYHSQIIAKPFKILVTDRRKEPDTLKWMTKIYIPVVE